jgi:hypothetical protein
MSPFGGIPWNRGLNADIDSRIKKGYHLSPETIKKIKKSNIGKTRSIETRKKISLSKQGKWKGIDNPNFKGKITKGHKVSEEQKKKVQRLMKGRVITWGEKISKFRKGNPRFMGENHYLWQGGISFEPYSIDWKESLRRSIRERDRYICKICNKIQGDRAFDVHHINYDKKNCNPNNLITLCHSCHTKTNTNRKYWIEYFSNKLNML